MAAAFKLKGNEAFKSGNFAAAVGAYTDAILADPKDPTLPLNRAAAYLKLNKFQDAERDCGKVLLVDPKNIKALFRRGQARSGLGNYAKALVDLNQVLSLEPSNQVAKQEKSRVEELLKQAESSNNTELREPIDVTSSAPRRRRVPIEIVEDDTPPPQATRADESAPDSNLNKKPIIEEISASATAGAPKSFQKAKEERETRTTRIIGGGIFKKDGSNSDSIFKPRVVVDVTDNPVLSSTLKRTTADVEQNSKPPTNSFEFQRRWNASSDAHQKWTTLHSLSPESLPSFFKSSLEPSLIGSILEVILHMVTSGSVDAAEAARYLKGLGQIPRFNALVLFLDPKEKASATRLLQMVREQVGWTV